MKKTKFDKSVQILTYKPNTCLNSGEHYTMTQFLIIDIIILGTFRPEDENDYEYEFSVLSMRTSKNVGLQAFCACSVRKTRTGTRPRPSI